MIDERAARGEPEEVLRMLMLFARAQFFDQNFGYRRCLVQGLMQVKGGSRGSRDDAGWISSPTLFHPAARTGRRHKRACRWRSLRHRCALEVAVEGSALGSVACTRHGGKRRHQWVEPP
jgi:hypothetical protein